MSGFTLINGYPSQKMYIVGTTVIEKGELVVFTPATGVVASSGTDLDNPQIGVAAEAHASGGGTSIKVYTHPESKFSHVNRNAITATGGSTTTFVDSSLLPATDNLFIGGYLEIIACAADSSLNGAMIPITDNTGSGRTLTFATQIAAFASGDTAYLHPGKLAVGSFGWDLDSDGMNIDYETDGGEAMIIADANPELKEVIIKLRLHQLGNSTLAI